MDFSILTTNIVNYTGLCERLPEEKINRILDEYYFGIIHPALSKYDGELGNAIGDRQSAYWRNSKKNNGSFFACSAALEIMNNIRMDQELLPSENRFEVNIAITYGQADEFENILFGEMVDLNSLLLSVCQKHNVSVLIDESTNEMLKGEFPSREVDTIDLNDSNAVKIYAI